MSQVIKESRRSVYVCPSRTSTCRSSFHFQGACPSKPPWRIYAVLVTALMASLEVAQLYAKVAVSVIRSLLKTSTFKGVKWSLYVLVLLNLKSFPLAWHCKFPTSPPLFFCYNLAIGRVFWPVTRIRLSYLWLRVRTLARSRKVKDIELEKWLDGISPIGSHPFQMVTTWKNYASTHCSRFPTFVAPLLIPLFSQVLTKAISTFI